MAEINNGYKLNLPGSGSVKNIPFNPNSRGNQDQVGVQQVDEHFTSIREPMVINTFMLVCTRYAAFLNKTARTLFQTLIVDNAKSVSGPPENSIATVDTTHGSTKTPISHATGYEQSSGELSITAIETSGSPLSKLIQYYLHGISDPDTGIRHLWGYQGSGLPAYSSDFLVVLLGPSGRPDDIEFSYGFYNAFPTTEIRAQYTATRGEPSTLTEIEIAFKGRFVINKQIDELAVQMIKASGIYNQTTYDFRLARGEYGLMTQSIKDLRNEVGSSLDRSIKGSYLNEVENEGNINGSFKPVDPHI